MIRGERECKKELRWRKEGPRHVQRILIFFKLLLKERKFEYCLDTLLFKEKGTRQGRPAPKMGKFISRA